jgi:hypothetical protein
VWGGTVAGLFAAPANTGLKNGMTFRANFARDISENFYVGASLWGGFETGAADSVSAFAIAADFGVLIRLRDAGFLHNMRVGIVLANLGKTFNTPYGIYGYKDTEWNRAFPGALTPKAGFAAEFVDRENFLMGFSTGASFPTVQNVCWNIGLDTFIANCISINVGWDVNLRETLELNTFRLPSVTLAFTFHANTGKSKLMAKQGWSQSDFTPALQYRSLGKGLNAVSAGMSANFGTTDKEPPVIKLGAPE